MVYPSSQNKRYLVSKNFCFFKKKVWKMALKFEQALFLGTIMSLRFNHLM
jgi:hypothetical protein